MFVLFNAQALLFFLSLNLFAIFMELKEILDESFLNLLFPENDDDGDDNALNGDSLDEASSDGINDELESNAELTPGNTTDEEYERKNIFISILLFSDPFQ